MFRTLATTGRPPIYSRAAKKNAGPESIAKKVGNKCGQLQLYTSGAVSDEHLSADSFEELAMPLFDSLYNFARWLTHDREEAEDLVQETYAKALKGFGSFAAGTNFRAWMYRILRNTFLTSRTGLKSGMTVSLDSGEGAEPAVPATTETPESLFLERASQQMVQEAIAELPAIFREVVLLCDVEEMSYQEIAQVISIPIGTVMSRLARARNALRVTLAKKLQGA
jgi:RNA polymerase sigma-70 factor (ECF subfamily)